MDCWWTRFKLKIQFKEYQQNMPPAALTIDITHPKASELLVKLPDQSSSMNYPINTLAGLRAAATQA